MSPSWQVFNIKLIINLGVKQFTGPEVYRFRVGAFECRALRDGTFTYPNPAALLFANAPRERLREALRGHGVRLERWGEWVSPYTCLMINTGRHRVLVDTGAGNLGPDTGRLLQNLQAEGISAEEIDTVVITHGHPDHIGGNIVKGRPAFPRAHFVMWEREWDFWTSEPSLKELKVEEHVKKILVTSAVNNLLPIRGQLQLLDHEGEIMPGIHAVAAPGHTPGHMALDVSSGGERMLVVADVMIHPLHLERPDWYSAVDLYPAQAIATRRRFLDRASGEEMLVAAFHFPFPGLGRIVQEEGSWRWQPISRL